MTPQEKQLIESLFQRLAQAAPNAGPRDPEAEALIQQRMQSFPGGSYYMAQTLLVQERALRDAEARLGSGGGSFLPPQGGPRYSQQGPPQWRGGGGGGIGSFLAGAGQMALGIGGGILVADAAMGLAHELFGDHGGYSQQELYADDGGDGGDQYEDQGDSGDSGGDDGGGDW